MELRRNALESPEIVEGGEGEAEFARKRKREMGKKGLLDLIIK